MRTEEGFVYSSSLKILFASHHKQNVRKGLLLEKSAVSELDALTEGGETTYRSLAPTVAFKITTEVQPDARDSGSAGRSVADQSRAAGGRLG